ncbi:MAG: hypothetical protein KF770_15605 [Anaerolineae bacterium]|nr:hypothetical protein [Anaerolineae bacterium]
MADKDKKQRFEKTISGIQQRYGLKAIQPLKQTSSAPIPHLPTGFPDLDAALGTGGLPHGRITELIGMPTSGMSTLALKVIASVQRQGGTAVYLDVPHTFDPDYAHRCGVNLRQMMLVHPYYGKQAIAMLPDFAVNGGFGLLLLDMPLSLQTTHQEQLSSALGRLLAPLHQSGAVLLCLTSLQPTGDGSLSTYPAQAALPHYASLRLLIQKERWLYRRQDIYGYTAQVKILKNKLGLSGHTVPITITFNGTVKSDEGGVVP